MKNDGKDAFVHPEVKRGMGLGKAARCLTLASALASLGVPAVAASLVDMPSVKSEAGDQVRPGQGRPLLETFGDRLNDEMVLADAGLTRAVRSAVEKSSKAVGDGGRRVALVIGNSDYNAEIGRLLNPTKDAKAIAEALERTGFEVHLWQNVTRDEMMQAVLQFDHELRDSDVGLFYYAGHAVQVNGRNFMIPTGASLNIASSRPDVIADYVSLETVEINDVLGRMGNAEADLNIVILDACRNNPFIQKTRGVSRGLAQTAAPRGTFVAYATSPNSVAQDGDYDNSPYTAAILKHLETPGLQLESVFKLVRQDVALQTNGEQIPWENSSVFGDFYFKEAAPEPLPPPIPQPEPQTTQPEPRPESDGPLDVTETALLTDDVDKEAMRNAPPQTMVEVQRLLARMKIYRGGINGRLDDKTKNAINEWKSIRGLPQDGQVSSVDYPLLRTDVLRVEELGELPKPQQTLRYLPPLPGRNQQPSDVPAAPERNVQEDAPPAKKKDSWTVFGPPA